MVSLQDSESSLQLVQEQLVAVIEAIGGRV